MSAASPVRFPDTRSRTLMTKRAWWLVVLNILIPGSAQVLAGNRRAGRFALGATLVLWVIAALALVIGLVDRTVLLSVVTNSVALWVVVVALVFYAILWLCTTLDTLRLVRLIKVAPTARGFVAGLSVAALVVTAGGAGFAAANAVSAIGVLDQVFSGGEVAEPIDGRYNILLLGGDAGPDRMGMRPDSISVVSIDAGTGSAVIFGIPRNMERVPFHEGSPLYTAFPNGYDCGDECLISYLYTYGQEHPELYPDAEANGSQPGIEATRDAVSGVLGLELQYYVLIDMQGFAQLIDALGGVTITVEKEVPYGANTYDDGTPAPPAGVILPGEQKMAGWKALWYARSRYGSNDYERMERQRQVQEAILQQFEPGNIVTKFQGVAAAGADVVSTDIPQPMLAHFVELGAKTRELPIEKLNFTPPEFDGVYPDFEYIRQRVEELTVIDETSG